MQQYTGDVLVVEDNQTNLLLLEAMLSQRGLSVTVAENGEQAVQAVMSAKFDLVLMDLQMPVMGGYQATARIRQWDQAQHLARSHIVAMSADSAPEDRQRCVAADMDDFMAKPISAGELNRVLTDWLGTAPSSVSPAPVEDTPCAMVFDQGSMLKRLGGDRGLATQMVQSVIDSLPSYMERLELALADGDPIAARQVLHAMTGVVAQIGGAALALRIKGMSSALQSATMIDHSVLLPFRHDYSELMERLAEWRG